jgi:hypothetical protein
MKKSLKLLTSGIPGFNLFSSSPSSSGPESKKAQNSRAAKNGPLKSRIISRAKQGLAGVEELGKMERLAIIGLITQALDTTTDDRILEMMRDAREELDAILKEFERPALKVGNHVIRAVEFVDE